jgi:thymidylate synthase (FAD)
VNKINVLDHGFVELVDFMGDDYRILQSARVSTGGVAQKGDKEDRGLIRYLYLNKHLSPFEQVVFTFHVKMPILVARQWMRHRTFSYNEYSLRYSEAIKDYYIPADFRIQGVKNHQGSGDVFDEDNNLMFKDIYEETIEQCESAYDGFIEEEVAREIARGVLPVAQYTEMYMTVNLRNLLHFLNLRLHEHAQYEIRVYAEAILQMLKSIEQLKWTIEIFEEMNQFDYTLLSMLDQVRKEPNGIEHLRQYILNFNRKEQSDVN